MALFNDLDFLWPFMSFEAFKVTGESMDLSPKEFFDFYSKDEKVTRRPFCCEETKKMFDVLSLEISKLI